MNWYVQEKVKVKETESQKDGEIKSGSWFKKTR